MASWEYSEDQLVQQTISDYLRDNLGWETVFAYNEEGFGPESLLGRQSDREVVLRHYLREKLVEFNPDFPEEAYDAAVRKIEEYNPAQSMVAVNREKYHQLKDGVQVSFRDSEDNLVRQRLRVFDFDNPENNHFLAVREFWIRGELYRRRADIVGFVNGIPLLFVECKNMGKNLRLAYDQNISDYRDTIPHVFSHNAIILLANGEKAKIGTISTGYEKFHDWKRLSEEDEGVVEMETLLKGVCDRRIFMDLFENFIVFNESSGAPFKILARNHQYLGVNRAVESVKNRRELQGKLGVFWHTQGAGKSYSMVFFTRKVHRKLGGNFTFLICTDRKDLDSQIYRTFAGCGLADNERDPCRPSGHDQLAGMLGLRKAYLFTLIHKFHQDVDPEEPYSRRDDIIVITDEAHRTQYGTLALNLRNALPAASFIGFTGTPLFKDDEITRRVFGDYVSTYDFKRAVEDNATVPLYYDARGEKLGITTDEINERIAEKLEELETDDLDVQERLERELARDYHIITAQKRLEQVARDFVEHYSKAWDVGKALLVCIDKITCGKMYDLIEQFWQERIHYLEGELESVTDEDEREQRLAQLDWMRQTEMAMIVSEEQGEVDKFRKWGLDIIPHRRLIKNGFDLSDGTRLDVDSAFKDAKHPFRIGIVCAMWLTGFDVPSLANLYLDKPLKTHTLMQAIARANRVHRGKNNGLIIDYCGILKNLREALATFAGQGDQGHGGTGGAQNPARPEEELLEELEEAISLVVDFLEAGKAPLEDIIRSSGMDRNAAIVACKEVANQNDETRKRFEAMCREVFRKFKACINIREVNTYRDRVNAINIVYKSLQSDVDQVDISDIIRQLHEIIDEAIETVQTTSGEESRKFNISKIDFDKLRQEFSRSPRKNTTVQSLKNVIDKRVQNMLNRNPLRPDLQAKYEEIIQNYNKEKDRATIERTFEELLKFVKQMDEEEQRAAREGLDEEALAIYDLLKKDDLTKKEIERIKQVATELLQKLKAEKLKVDHWRERENTSDAVLVEIRNYLYDDNTGLPVDTYSVDEVNQKAEEVYRHVYRVYPTVPSPLYAEAS